MSNQEINRTPREIKVQMVKKWDVNGTTVNGEILVVLLMDVPQDSGAVAVVGLPFGSAEEVNELIADLKKIRNITWPGESDANNEDRDVIPIDSPPTVGRKGSASCTREEPGPDYQGPEATWPV